MNSIKLFLFISLMVFLPIESAVAEDAPAVPIPAPTPAAPSDAPCPQEFADIVKLGEKSAAEIKEIYTSGEITGLKQFRNLNWPIVNKTRDTVRRFFQRLNKHDYPIVSLDDGTSANALAVAKDAFGDLADGAGIDIAAQKANFSSMLSSVQSYPQRLQAFFDQTSTMQAQYDFLEQYLKAHPNINGGITLKVPVVTTDATGKQVITAQEQFWPTRIGLENAMDKMKTTLKQNKDNNFFNLNPLKPSDTSNIATAQGINIRRLETFHDQLKVQMVAHPGKALPADLQAIYDAIDKLYANGRLVKPEFDPPDWAWQRLNWLSFNRETVSLIQKDVVADKPLLDFVKGLTPEEQRAIGIGNLADGASLLKRTKWWQAVAAIGTPAAGGGYSLLNNVVLPTYNFYVSDAKAKETCAAKTTDADFISCAQDYLKVKFVGPEVASILANKAAFVNPDGNISNPALRKEVQDLIQRRMKFAQKQNLQNNAQTVLSDYITKLMASGDISSDAYHDKMLCAPADTDFITAVMGSTKPPVPSYLAFKFPVYFAKEKALVAKALTATYGSPDQKKIMDTINKEASSLGTELQDLLDKRNTFKQTGSVPPGSTSNSTYTTAPDPKADTQKPVAK